MRRIVVDRPPGLRSLLVKQAEAVIRETISRWRRPADPGFRDEL
jgi:hypothetical protein